MMRDDIDHILLSEEDLKAKVEEIGAQISKDYADSENFIMVSVLKGSVVFVSDLMRAVTIPAEIGGKLVGGFCIGAGNKNQGDGLTITGCVFDGKIAGAGQSGGFVAWGTSALTIKDSLVVPQSGSDISGGTFCYEGSGAAVL